jgi:predicted ester cyclase
MSEMENRNKALVRRIYEELWNQGNLTVAREIFAEPEGVEKFVKEFLAAFPDLQHTIEEMIAEGDRVAARFSAKGTHTGQWKQYAPLGNRIYYTGVTIASIAGDKITHHHTWWDTMEVIEQIRGKSS